MFSRQDVASAQQAADTALDNNFFFMAVVVADLAFELWKKAYPKQWTAICDDSLQITHEITGLDPKTIAKVMASSDLVYDTIGTLRGKKPDTGHAFRSNKEAVRVAKREDVD